MKKHRLLSYLLIPSMFILLLLPLLSCIAFHYTAKQHAYMEEAQNLDTLQKKLMRTLRKNFLTDTEDTDADTINDRYSTRLKSFLESADTLLRRTDGNADMIILNSEMEISYPLKGKENAEALALAGEFVSCLLENSEAYIDNSVKFEADNGEIYIMNVRKITIKSSKIQYLIVYCPAFQIDKWVKDASLLVCLISSVPVLLALVVLWITARSVTQPLQCLCAKSEQIGQGSFEEIKRNFTIKELENLRLSMNRMSDKLKQSDEIQRNFFQNISHELRTPLMSISGYAQGIEQGVFHSPEQAAHTILEESTRLTELVNSLLTLSRLESFQLEERFRPILLADSIEPCLNRLTVLAMQKGIFLVQKPFNRDIMTLGEEELIDKVLDNLLNNAIRYAESIVTISVSADNEKILISVADDGDGIAEKDLPHLFERCYKGSRGNFGLGLSIARSAAQKMGGEIRAANQEDGGAVFTFSLNRYKGRLP